MSGLELLPFLNVLLALDDEDARRAEVSAVELLTVCFGFGTLLSSPSTRARFSALLAVTAARAPCGEASSLELLFFCRGGALSSSVSTRARFERSLALECAAAPWAGTLSFEAGFCFGAPSLRCIVGSGRIATRDLGRFAAFCGRGAPSSDSSATATCAETRRSDGCAFLRGAVSCYELPYPLRLYRSLLRGSGIPSGTTTSASARALRACNAFCQPYLGFAAAFAVVAGSGSGSFAAKGQYTSGRLLLKPQHTESVG